MKTSLKTAGIIGQILIICMLAACGGNGRADEKYCGKWISVAGEALGMTLSGEDIAGFGLELKSGGKATMTVEEKSRGVKWTNDDTSITVKAGSTEMVGTLGEDTIVFDDMLGMGMKITFAKEGTEAAKREDNMPEADKKMIGTWQSHTVTDVLGEPIDGMDGSILKMVFSPDYTVQVYMDGEDYGTTKWSLFGDNWGSVDDENVDINWDITDDGINVNYSNGDEYYTFICTKQNGGL